MKGYSNDQTSDKIVDNSSSSISVISLTNSYLKIDNLTISGSDIQPREVSASIVSASHGIFTTASLGGTEVEGVIKVPEVVKLVTSAVA